MAGASNDLIFDKIECRKRYKLSLDRTNAETFSLQYAFKPVSVDTGKPGQLCMFDNQEAIVELCRADDSTESFKGTTNESISGQENECLLIFDQDSFRVVKIGHSIVNLRPIRSDSTAVVQSVSEPVNVSLELKKRAEGLKKRKAASMATTGHTEDREGPSSSNVNTSSARTEAADMITEASQSADQLDAAAIFEDLFS